MLLTDSTDRSRARGVGALSLKPITSRYHRRKRSLSSQDFGGPATGTEAQISYTQQEIMFSTAEDTDNPAGFPDKKEISWLPKLI